MKNMPADYQRDSELLARELQWTLAILYDANDIQIRTMPLRCEEEERQHT